MIHGGERPHTGAATQPKRVEVAESIPGATSTSLPRGLEQSRDLRELQGSPGSATSHSPSLAACTSPGLAWLWGIASGAGVPVRAEGAVGC